MQLLLHNGTDLLKSNYSDDDNFIDWSDVDSN